MNSTSKRWAREDGHVPTIGKQDSRVEEQSCHKGPGGRWEESGGTEKGEQADRRGTSRE